MGQVVVLQIAPGKDGLDEGETHGGTIAHRDRYRAVQLDHRRRLDAEQNVVEPDDLAPVGGIGAVCSANNRVAVVSAVPLANDHALAVASEYSW
jgi:hypothetical protein